MKALEKLRQVSMMLIEAGIEHPEREAENIIAHHGSISRESMFTEDPALPETVSEDIDRAVKRRTDGEPLQYILGSVEFCGSRLKVGRGVLIPRPETELLAEEVTKEGGDEWKRLTGLRDSGERPYILDLCTGSGCLAVAIAKAYPFASVTGTDVSAAALEYARENAEINFAENVDLVLGDLFGPVEKRKYHLIVSNPPYIRTKDLETLQREIREWEPKGALDGGEDGLDCYRNIIRGLDGYLHEEGRCYLEIGYDQRDAVERLAKGNNFEIRFIKDLAGIHRIAVLSF